MEPWQVIRQRETIHMDADTQQFGRVVEVMFRTAGGTVATVNVPTDRYTADNVRAAIDEYVAHISAVEQLGNT